uniref:Bm539 n=1 Tax=Loa loa TaxID=7209 RepID=A0A1I7V9J5_LOALO
MEPFGFTHLRAGKAIDVAPTISNQKYKKNCLDVLKLTKSQQLSMRHLYYPVNMPVCRYQKRLILDSLYNNMLITLPKELDTFFIAAVVMFNFHRWFPIQKVVCICKNVESSLNTAKRFAEITGYSQGICVYANLKKSERCQKWIQQDIIFATAEVLVADFTGREELSKICLMIVEDAHRAISGSNPLSELIRNCILQKAKFRVLAYTDCKVDKVGQLQLIVMNLQIDLIRSLSSIREEISLVFASPRISKFYITINEDIRHIGKELLKVMEPIASLLCESGIFPTNDIKKIANFSTSYLQKKVQNGRSHLAEIYCDFFELLSAYDILMCDGLTAFRNTLQALSSQSTTIVEIIQSSDILRKACIPPRFDNLECHKLDMLVTLLMETCAYYAGQKSTVIVLCRKRDPLFVDSLLLSIKAQLSSRESRFAFFLFKKNDHQIEISENSMKDQLCNVIIVPCDSDAIEINIDYVDSIICMDEGLCALHYTGTIRVQSTGSICALCSAGYETNICNFLAVEGTVDYVQADHIKGLQLCNDVLPMLPFNVIPEIVEYWAQNIDDSDGLLTMIQRLDFQERLAFNSPLDRLNLIEDKCSLLNFCVKETFLWQDRLQRFTLLGHSISASNLANVLGRDPEILTKQVLRLQNKQRLKWMDEDSQSSKAEDANLIELHSKLGQNSKPKCSEKPSGQKRLAKGSSRKRDTTKVPRLNRIDSASFTLFKVFKTELTAGDFVNRIEEQGRYRERLEQITEIIHKLNGLIRL